MQCFTVLYGKLLIKFSVSKSAGMKYACDMLGCSVELMEECLTKRSVETKRDFVLKTLSEVEVSALMQSLTPPSSVHLSPPTFTLPFFPSFLPSLPPSPFLAPLTLQAAYARDALCKAIYTRLFTWLVNRINDRIKVSITLFYMNDRKPLIQTMRDFKYLKYWISEI